MRKGTALLNKGKEQFFAKLTDSELVPIEIPEWEGTVYRPVSVSVERMSRIKLAMEAGGLEHLIQIIIDISRDEDGKPLFRASDRDSLLREQDPAVVVRLANELSDALTPETVEDVEGNSETATSGTSTPSPSN